MKKCYVAAGEKSNRLLFLYKKKFETYGRGENVDIDHRFLFVDICQESKADLGKGAEFIYLEPEIDLKMEGAGKEVIDRIAGHKAAAALAEYARKFAPFMDEFFDTEELELAFIIDSYGKFLQGAAFDIINFYIIKIACTYAKTRLRVKILVFSDEFTIDGTWDPIDDRFALTKFFLDRYMVEKSKLSQFLEWEELYIIDSMAYSNRVLSEMIGFVPDKLEKIDMKSECMAESSKRKVDALKLGRNSFGWKD